MTAVGYFSNTEEIIKASWSLFQHEGKAANILSEWFPLQPALSAKDLPGGWTQILNVHRIRGIDHHSIESDEDSAPESISDSENWLNRNRNFHNPNDSKDDYETDFEFDREPDHGIENPESPEQRNVSTAPNVPVWIWSSQQLRRQTEMVFMTVNEMEMKKNMRMKKKWDWIH